MSPARRGQVSSRRGWSARRTGLRVPGWPGPQGQSGRGPGSGGRGSRALFTPSRAAALLGLLAAVGTLYGLAATPAFTLGRVEIPDLQWTTREALVDAVATSDGVNLFRLEVGPIERRLRDLPGVASAAVSVSLPDTLVVEVSERRAILVWAVGDARFLADRSGMLFASTDPVALAEAHLPVILDRRLASAGLEIGSILDPLDLDAATRLGSLEPTDVASSATSLVVSVSDASGFIVGTRPGSWTAIFGLYTPSLRTPAIIPGQVRLLRSLLAGRERDVARIILADEKAGTYVPRVSPAP